MAATKTRLRKHNAPGDNWADYSVVLDTVYAATAGEALSFNTDTEFPNHVRQVVVLRHPTGYRVMATLRTSLTPTNVRLIVQGSASTTSGKGETAFLALTTGHDCSSFACHIRVFGD